MIHYIYPGSSPLTHPFAPFPPLFLPLSHILPHTDTPPSKKTGECCILPSVSTHMPRNAIPTSQDPVAAPGLRQPMAGLAPSLTPSFFKLKRHAYRIFI